MNAKATVYLDPKVLEAAKIKAAHTDKSLSYLVNEALKLSLREDAIDCTAFGKRAQESARSLESVLKNLKRDGIL